MAKLLGGTRIYGNTQIDGTIVNFGGLNLSSANGTNISSGNTITSIIRSNSGSGYTGNTTVTISAPTTVGGVTATANSTMEQLTSTIVSGGTGYSVNDVLTVVGGTVGSQSAQFTVTGVSGGVITSINMFTRYGRYYSIPANPISVTGGTGTGATFNITSWAVAPDFAIINPGSGYVDTPTVTIAGPGGSNGSAYVTVGGVSVVKSLGISTVGNVSDSVQFKTASGIAFSIGERIFPTVNYFTALGNGTNGQAILRSIGSDTNVSATIGTQGTGTIQFHTNTTSGNKQMEIGHVASAVNYVQVTGSATGSGATISTQGSDSNVRMILNAKGSSSGFDIQMNGSRQMFIGGNGSAVNWLNVGGSATGVAPYIQAQGNDTNVDLALYSKGTSSVVMNTGNGIGFKVSDTGSTAANFLTAVNQATGNGPRLRAEGSDTNVNLVFSSKGTGTILFFTNTEANRQFQITDTASAVNYIQVTGGATNVPPVISVAGSDANVDLTLTTKNSGILRLQSGNANVLRLRPSANPVNYFDMYQSATGVAPSIRSEGNDTNIDISLVPKGTGIVKTTTTGLGTTAGNTQDLVSFAGNSGNAHYLKASMIRNSNGSDWTTATTRFGLVTDVTQQGYIDFNPANNNWGVSLNATGSTGTIQFFANSTEQLRVTPTASAVNYVQVTGAATGGSAPTISVKGSDSNITLALESKNSAAVAFVTNSAVQFDVYGPASAVNRIRASGGILGSSPSLNAAGTDTNIDLSLYPKGTGTVVVNGPFTATGQTSLGGAPGSEGLRVTTTASGTRYVAVSGSTNTGNPNIIASAGNLVVSGGSTSGVIFYSNSYGSQQMVVSHTASTVNYVQVTGAATGSGPTISTQGSDTNIDVNVTSKGVGVFKFQSSYGTHLSVGSNSTTPTTAYPIISGDQYGRATYGSSGATVITASGTNSIAIQTGSTAYQQFVVTNTTSAVNYIQVTGSATGGAPNITAQGSDANVALLLRSKGTYACEFQSSAGTILLQALPVASSVNYLRVSPSVASSAPVLSAQGSDTNIDLTLTAKGTGVTHSTTPLRIENDTTFTSNTVITTSTSSGQILESVSSTYRSVEFTIQGLDDFSSHFQKVKLLAIHNGSVAEYTEYGNITIGGSCGTFSVVFNSGTGTMDLVVTPTSANTTVFKVTSMLTAN